MRRRGAALLCALQLLALGRGEDVRQYCIVGGGPAGVQLGHFFKHAGRDYVIYEASSEPGSFFRKMPIHRTLISINKRKVREGRSSEFAMRHDWNSLLDVRPKDQAVAPMTSRSKAYFPDAGTLADYLAEFAAEQAGAIEYGVRVSKIRKVGADGADGEVFELQLSRAQQGGAERARCRQVIVAAGFSKPRGAESSIDGVDELTGYEDLPAGGESFEGKAVMVMGFGNAALETVQALQPYTSELHLLGRRRELPQGGKGVRFAYQTHYVGDVRAGRTTILDSYLLKSLDTFDPDVFVGNNRLIVLPCHGQRKCVFVGLEAACADDECKEGHKLGHQGLNYKIPLLTFVKDGPTGKAIRELLAEHTADDAKPGWAIVDYQIKSDQKNPSNDVRNWLIPEFSDMDEKDENRTRPAVGIDDKVFKAKMEILWVTTRLLRSNPELLDALQRYRQEMSPEPYRYPMDSVIKCFGWVMDTSVFDEESIQMETMLHGKYPVLTAGYELPDTPGLYFAGTLTHGLDFRKSAGGFIHGFRYTARALFRLLEEKNFGAEWPHVATPLPVFDKDNMAEFKQEFAEGVNVIADAILRRINEAAAPYQMFQSLSDMVIFEGCDVDMSGTPAAKLLEEVPLALFHERYRHLPRLVWVFRYGKDFYGPAVVEQNRVASRSAYDAQISNFLHPYLAYYPAGETEPTMRHWIYDDVITQWTGHEATSPLTRFVARATAAALQVPGDNRWVSFLKGVDEERLNAKVTPAEPDTTCTS